MSIVDLKIVNRLYDLIKEAEKTIEREFKREETEYELFLVIVKIFVESEIKLMSVQQFLKVKEILEGKMKKQTYIT